MTHSLLINSGSYDRIDKLKLNQVHITTRSKYQKKAKEQELKSSRVKKTDGSCKSISFQIKMYEAEYGKLANATGVWT